MCSRHACHLGRLHSTALGAECSEVDGADGFGNDGVTLGGVLKNTEDDLW